MNEFNNIGNILINILVFIIPLIGGIYIYFATKVARIKFKHCSVYFFPPSSLHMCYNTKDSSCFIEESRFIAINFTAINSSERNVSLYIDNITAELSNGTKIYLDYQYIGLSDELVNFRLYDDVGDNYTIYFDSQENKVQNITCDSITKASLFLKDISELDYSSIKSITVNFVSSEQSYFFPIKKNLLRTISLSDSELILFGESTFKRERPKKIKQNLK